MRTLCWKVKSRGLKGFGEGIQDVRDALIAHVFGILSISWHLLLQLLILQLLILIIRGFKVARLDHQRCFNSESYPNSTTPRAIQFFTICINKLQNQRKYPTLKEKTPDNLKEMKCTKYINFTLISVPGPVSSKTLQSMPRRRMGVLANLSGHSTPND